MTEKLFIVDLSFEFKYRPDFPRSRTAGFIEGGKTGGGMYEFIFKNVPAKKTL